MGDTGPARTSAPLGMVAIAVIVLGVAAVGYLVTTFLFAFSGRCCHLAWRAGRGGEVDRAVVRRSDQVDGYRNRRRLGCGAHRRVAVFLLVGCRLGVPLLRTDDFDLVPVRVVDVEGPHAFQHWMHAAADLDSVLDESVLQLVVRLAIDPKSQVM